MDIPQSLIDQAMRQEVRSGDVYKVSMTIEDGITPKGGYSSRKKFFIVLGFDDDGNIYGGVVINSKINPNLSATITDFCMPIKKEVYPFLDHNSFVNCTKLKTPTANKLLAGEKVGEISQEDCDLIVGTVINSPHETKARLRQFGLI
ncbi:MAG: hypothetical protein SPI35_05800 [Porphyromonas sp.]|nr:hypothetical protein [Porphyromonas sp.]